MQMSPVCSVPLCNEIDILCRDSELISFLFRSVMSSQHFEFPHQAFGTLHNHYLFHLRLISFCFTSFTVFLNSISAFTGLPFLGFYRKHKLKCSHTFTNSQVLFEQGLLMYFNVSTFDVSYFYYNYLIDIQRRQ